MNKPKAAPKPTQAAEPVGYDFGAEKITPDSLDKTALHELLHIFLYDLLCVATDRQASEEDREMQEHRIINLLEHLLTKDSNGRT